MEIPKLVVTNGVVWVRETVKRGRRHRNGDPGLQAVWASVPVVDVLEAIAAALKQETQRKAG